ncbi:MAG: HNH endonuclease [Alcanivorax sp.]|uniref:HNH endonuclease n=1 Tax=Alcanivorax sp. TaxID=1872427 RepID=UPI003DA7830B
MYFFREGVFVGEIYESEMEGLPNDNQNSLLGSVKIIEKRGGAIRFTSPEVENVEEVFRKLGNFYKNKNHSNNRADNLDFYSFGVYEKSDIEEIYNLQGGVCYYTRAPVTKNPKNFSIDHIVPVTKGGGSWPGNLAISTIDFNREKHNHSKRKMFSILEKRYGKDWLEEQKEFCKKIDKARRVIDKRRREIVFAKLAGVEQDLQKEFPKEYIEYGVWDEEVVLYVNNASVKFSAGFLRNKKKAYSFHYLSGVIKAIQ